MNSYCSMLRRKLQYITCRIHRIVTNSLNMSECIHGHVKFVACPLSARPWIEKALMDADFWIKRGVPLETHIVEKL